MQVDDTSFVVTYNKYWPALFNGENGCQGSDPTKVGCSTGFAMRVSLHPPAAAAAAEAAAAAAAEAPLKSDDTVVATPRCTNQSDCTAELQAALDDSTSLVVDVAPLPNNRPWIVRPIHILRSHVTVIFRPGVHIQAKRWSFHGATDCLLNIWNVANVTIIAHGATFTMWKQDYVNASLYEKAEWRHAFWISGSMVASSPWHGHTPVHGPCDGITVEGGDVSLTGGDAMQIECTNVTVRRLYAHDNYRQGISILGASDSLFEDCILANTSGTGPGSGLQIEPWHAADVVHNVTIRRCHSENNQGSGFCVALGALNGTSHPTYVSIEDCTVSGSRTVAGLAITSPRGSVRGSVSIRNLTVTGTGCWGANIYNHAAGGNHTVDVQQSTFTGTALQCTASSEPSPLSIGYFSWQPAPPGPVGGVTIQTSRVVDNLSRPFLLETTGGAKYREQPYGVSNVTVSVVRGGQYASSGGCNYSLESPVDAVSGDVHISCTPTV